MIFGGRSGEHEISLRSARAIIEAMDPSRYEVVPVGIAPDGRWLIGSDPLTALEAGDTHQLTPTTLRLDPKESGLAPLAPGVEAPGVDVAFPVLHGTFGEDGTIQGLLELAGIPYVGCGVAGSAVGMDKGLMKAVFQAAGLPQVAYRVLTRAQWEADPARCRETIRAALEPPLFVKPCNLGSSVGVVKVRSWEELGPAMDEAAGWDRRIIVEQGVPAREIEVSVLGNDAPEASVPGEVVPSAEFYDYADKYLDGTSELRIPAPLSPERTDEVRRLAIAAFTAIDGAGLARVDFLYDDQADRLYLNEVNTLPGFTTISMYPKLWEASGLPFDELVDRLIELARDRHRDRVRNRTQYGSRT